MDPRADLAARNNAEWCDLVCRAHGIETLFDEDGWFAGRRTPRFYPDAVTLREGLAAGDLLPRIDSSPGCSIKDSFASVDLSGDGFGLLFEAEWIHREPTPQRIGSGLRWAAMQTADASFREMMKDLKAKMLPTREVKFLAMGRSGRVE